MDLIPLQELALILREDAVPFFTEEQLSYYLEKNGGNVEQTAYHCLLVKAEDTTINISGMTTADTSSYFRRLAGRYRPNNSSILKGEY